MEMFYEFCGIFDKQLKTDYRKSKMKKKGVTFSQFCVITFANFMEEANQALNIKPKKNGTRKSKMAKV